MNGGDAMVKTTTGDGDQPGLKMVNPGAAAIDIGSTMHMAAVNPDRDEMKAEMTAQLVTDALIMRSHQRAVPAADD
jgi:hypothetical protein